MRRSMRSAALALTLLVAASCAVTGGKTGGEGAPGSPGQEIAALNRALETEKDTAKISGLLFRRGHAYLEEADRLRESLHGRQASATEARDHSFFLLNALRDFEDLATDFPQSADAPEALFHLGVIYDYPNLSVFELALNYYQRTLERYPGTESARKAGIAIGNIRAMMRDVEGGRHGVPQRSP
jgi:hypothetical protein